MKASFKVLPFIFALGLLTLGASPARAAGVWDAFGLLPFLQDLFTNYGIALRVILAFFIGLALNLTPCVYPLVPITVSYFGGQTSSRSRNLALVGTYGLGMVAMYSSLGIVAALGGGFLGALRGHPLVIGLMALLILAMALSQFGLWEPRLPSRLTTAAGKTRTGLTGTFFMGLTTGVLAASCLLPVVAALMAYVSKSGSLSYGLAIFIPLGLGLAAPLLVLALFSGAISRLPAAGTWLVWVRKLFGVLLVLAALWVAKDLIGEQAYRLGMVLVAAGGGVYLALLEPGGDSRRANLIKTCLGGALLVGAALFLWFSWPSAPVGGAKIAWQPLSAEALQQAKAANKPVLLDFQADWCTYCQLMEKTTYSDPRVVERSKKFVALRLDVTKPTPQKRAIMRALKVRGLPTVVFFNRQGRPMVELNLSGYRNAASFLVWLDLALARS